MELSQSQSQSVGGGGGGVRAVLPAPCSICLEPLLSEIGSVKCGHVYHVMCLYTWLEQKSSCPLCNKEVRRTHIRPLFLPFEDASASQAPLPELIDAGADEQSIELQKQQMMLKMKATHAEETRSLRHRMCSLTNDLETSLESLKESAQRVEELQRLSQRSSADLHSERLTRIQAAKQHDQQLNEANATISRQQQLIDKLQSTVDAQELLESSADGRERKHKQKRDNDVEAGLRRKVASMNAVEALEFLVVHAAYAHRRYHSTRDKDEQDLQVYREQLSQAKRANEKLRQAIAKLRRRLDAATATTEAQGTSATHDSDITENRQERKQELESRMERYAEMERREKQERKTHDIISRAINGDSRTHHAGRFSSMPKASTSRPLPLMKERLPASVAPHPQTSAAPLLKRERASMFVSGSNGVGGSGTSIGRKHRLVGPSFASKLKSLKGNSNCRARSITDFYAKKSS